MNSEQLIPFYLGERSDPGGRKIQEIWEWDFEQLECAHDYIQWLFPTSEKSAFNSDAPIVDGSIIDVFQSNPKLGENLRRSLIVMLHFYGFQLNEGAITKSENYSIRKAEWICLFDHNYLRITRILKCLMLFGLEAEARAFYECLRQVYQEEHDRIGAETFHYWTQAVKS
jgi:hypothetical protein